MPARRHLSFLLLCALAAPPLSGCGNHTRQELLESELRARDAQLRELVSELGKAEWRGDALRREVDVLRKGVPVPPEAASTFGLRRISLGRSTGGIDDDGMPGDEALAVFVEPRDADDHIIKVPGGRLVVIVLEIDAHGLKCPLDSWELNPEQLRQSYREALLSSGYSLRLPWRVFPRTENLRVIARLILPDERVFEADKDIRVRPVPGKSVREPVAPLPPEGPFLPGPELGPPPALVPPPAKTPEAAPALWRPTGKTPPAVRPVTHWEPASLVGAVRLGTPVPYDAAPGPP
ncbi:MAG: hypothetical protein U0793_34385 [Gemmataceae bacterium]